MAGMLGEEGKEWLEQGNDFRKRQNDSWREESSSSCSSIVVVVVVVVFSTSFGHVARLPLTLSQPFSPSDRISLVIRV